MPAPNLNDRRGRQFEVAVLSLVRAAAKAIMGLATLLAPVVIGRKYLPLHPVAGTCDHA
jgi:hypothetical protein